jgi:glycosyltransferase involved in cell wall biosynthesis
MPFVSFIALSFNHSKFLIETLNSIKTQSNHIDFEIIITDDSSKDNSVELIQDWVAQNNNEIKIQTLFNSENRGLCKTLNCAIGLAKGQWIKPIACDDILENNYLESIFKLIIKDDSIGLVCTDMSHINNNGIKIRESNWTYNQTDISNTIVNEFNNLLRAQYLNAPTLFFKRELWEKLGGYDESLIFEDWDFLLRAKKITKFAAIKESLVRYRMHENNMHLNFKTDKRYVIDVIKLLKKHLNETSKLIIREKVIKEITNLIPIDEDEALRIWRKEIAWLRKEEIIQPLVSVLIPVYNTERYIENAINSILFQTYSNIELIIVNDGSTDNSESIINKFVLTNNKIKYYPNTENLGISKTRNIGLSHCIGDFIVLLDSDDICAPNRIEKQTEFLIKNTGYKAVSSWMQEFGNKNPKQYRYNHDFETLKCVSVFYNPVSHAATMFDSKALKEIGYDENYSYAEDYHMFLRFIQKYKISCLQESLYFYRIHPNQSIGENNKNLQEQNEKQLSEYIASWYWNSKQESDIALYFHYIKKCERINDATSFVKWDYFLQRLYFNVSDKKLLNTEKLVDFIYKNYWFDNFSNHFKHFSIIQLTNVLRSPFCKFSSLSKFKYIVKKLFNK